MEIKEAGKGVTGSKEKRERGVEAIGAVGFGAPSVGGGGVAF